MLQALLKGKLSRDQENMEDLLTSCAFGTMSYLPPGSALLPFLDQALSIDGDRPLGRALSGFQDAVADYQFWPILDEVCGRRCEPDVVIRLDAPGRRGVLLVVECKYLSGKSAPSMASDEDMCDQLANQWNHCLSIAARENREPWLLFVTAHTHFPDADVRESIREFRRKRPACDADPSLVWCSWASLNGLPPDVTCEAAFDLRRLGSWIEGREVESGGFGTWRKPSGELSELFPDPRAMMVVQEIVRRSGLEIFARQPSGYAKLMGELTAAEVFPRQNGVVLALAEADNHPVCSHVRLERVELSGLLGPSAVNNNWLLGNGKNRTRIPAAAFRVPLIQANDACWQEVDPLLTYSREYADGR